MRDKVRPSSPPTFASVIAEYAAGLTTVEQEVRRRFERIKTVDPVLNVFMSLDRDAALERARHLDRAQADGAPLGPLHGIIVAIKDCIDIAGWVSTSGSIVRKDHVALETASCVRALVAAGAVVVGKTMMDEWAFGGSTENPHFGRTGNPWDAERTTGGSSGGSAAAVSAGLAALALGTDTGGSVRLPASLCGIVGFKPSLGRLALDHIEPLASTYDTLGMFAHHAEDVLRTFSVLDASISAPAEGVVDWGSVEFIRPDDMPTVEPVISSTYAAVLDRVASTGASVRSVPLPWLWEIPPYFRSVVLRELAEGHRSVSPEEKARYGAGLQESIAAGDRVTDREYDAALSFRDRVRAEYESLFREGTQTILIVPMTARVADEQGISFEDSVIWPDGTEEDYFIVSTRFTLFANVLGAPSITLPLNTLESALPIGVQMVGQRGSDVELLQASAAFQRLIGPPRMAPFRALDVCHARLSAPRGPAQ
jgi:aspartyl-tRNA(Asn)/glutamyl-tRNA(Gln) amidotransferase subunit A